MIHKGLLVAVLLTAATTATAQQPQQSMGTTDEQAACRPDTRRFCIHVKPEDGPFAYLACLQSNRAKLSKPCAQVLASHGQ